MMHQILPKALSKIGYPIQECTDPCNCHDVAETVDKSNNDNTFSRGDQINFEH